MEQEGPSFWADIKKYEETLEKDPNSYCFAPLSELYRRLGMLDDAITIAKRGCELHPDYVGGFMALGRGYFEKGMNTEARNALEKVVRVTPDNILAQRILSKIYMDSGDSSSAEGALKAILAQNPEDSESRMLLDSLIRTSKAEPGPMAGPEIQENEVSETGIKNEPGTDYDLFEIEELDEEIIDLEGCEIIEEFEQDSGQLPSEEAFEGFEIEPHEILDEKDVELLHAEEPGKKDPLTTVTLAELYAAQGYPKQALKIFGELSEADPENMGLKNRIIALKREIDEGEESAGEGSGGLETIPEQVVSGGFEIERVELEIPEEPMVEPELTPYPEIPEPLETTDAMFSKEDLAGDSCSHTAPEEQVIRTLEIWLENIKRRR
jgi:tetratricopeptide (TPR) repeat protein